MASAVYTALSFVGRKSVHPSRLRAPAATVGGQAGADLLAERQDDDRMQLELRVMLLFCGELFRQFSGLAAGTSLSGVRVELLAQARRDLAHNLSFAAPAIEERLRSRIGGLTPHLRRRRQPMAAGWARITCGKPTRIDVVARARVRSTFRAHISQLGAARTRRRRAFLRFSRTIQLTSGSELVSSRSKTGSPSAGSAATTTLHP